MPADGVATILVRACFSDVTLLFCRSFSNDDRPPTGWLPSMNDDTGLAFSVEFLREPKFQRPKLIAVSILLNIAAR